MRLILRNRQMVQALLGLDVGLLLLGLVPDHEGVAPLEGMPNSARELLELALGRVRWEGESDEKLVRRLEKTVGD